jgi:hypothetical protein
VNGTGVRSQKAAVTSDGKKITGLTKLHNCGGRGQGKRKRGEDSRDPQRADHKGSKEFGESRPERRLDVPISIGRAVLVELFLGSKEPEK